MNGYLTVTDWAALVRGLQGFGAGQDGTDDRITDDGPLLEEDTARNQHANSSHSNEGAASGAAAAVTWQLQEKHLS